MPRGFFDRKPPVSDAEFLMSRISVDASGCWLWQRSFYHDGYGKLRDSRAHRVSYEVHVGPIPDGEYVCHRCDVPACVNPEHLFLGSQMANIADMHAKGRNGGFGRSRKLSDRDVAEIRRIYATGTRYQFQIAADFGVTQGTISKITLGIHRRPAFVAARSVAQAAATPRALAQNSTQWKGRR